MYRKWRPSKFSEVYGQEHIRIILENAVLGDQLSHAYIFAGPRGVGKTSVARILAKNLNCKNPKNAQACDKCDNCALHNTGSNLDVLEIDAASNRGIDNIRSLIDKIKFVPTGSKYKIFIIDEAHMLSKESWNALLKTLEEPPEHAIFILVTTEPHKIPGTIHSRCQRLNFRQVSKSAILKRLSEVAKAEKIVINDAALSIIADNAKGGLRDAISLLDQTRSFIGSKITDQDLALVLGVSDKNVLENFLKLLNSGQSAQSFKVLAEIMNEGIDLEQFVDGLINLLRVGLKLKLGLERTVARDVGVDYAEHLKIYFETYSLNSIVKILNRLIEAKRELKGSDIIELPLEMVILDLDQTEPASKTEKPTTDQKPTTTKSVITTKSVKKINEKPKVKQSSVNLDQVLEKWPEFLVALKKYNNSLHAIFRDITPLEVDESQLVLGTTFKFYYERLKETKNSELVCQALAEVIPTPLGIKVKLIKEKPKAKTATTKKEEEILEDFNEVFN